MLLEYDRELQKFSVGCQEHLAHRGTHTIIFESFAKLETFVCRLAAQGWSIPPDAAQADFGTVRISCPSHSGAASQTERDQPHLPTGLSMVCRTM